MTLQIEFTWLVGLLLTFFAAAAGVGKLFLAQQQRHQDRRFNELERANSSMQSSLFKRLDLIEVAHKEEAVRVQRLEREFLEWKADLPQNYVRREDYIRGQTVLEAKLDGLATKIENFQLRAMNGGKHAN